MWKPSCLQFASGKDLGPRISSWFQNLLVPPMSVVMLLTLFFNYYAHPRMYHVAKRPQPCISVAENTLYQITRMGFSSNVYGQVFMYQLMIGGNIPGQKTLAAE